MVNVTMLVHNRLKLTEQALTSLYPSGHDMSVLVFDDASDGDTFDLLRQWNGADHGGCVRGTVNSYGTGEARNKAIRHSEKIFFRGDYLYLSDNDVYFKPGWLRVLTLCYEFAWEHGYAAIGAYNHPYHQPVSTLPVYGSYVVHEVHALALQSMIMKWEVWDRFGPFCQTPPGKVCQSEDVDFARKITAAGLKLGVVSPALVVNTGITNSFGEKIPGWELVKAQCPPGVLCE